MAAINIARFNMDGTAQYKTNPAFHNAEMDLFLSSLQKSVMTSMILTLTVVILLVK